MGRIKISLNDARVLNATKRKIARNMTAATLWAEGWCKKFISRGNVTGMSPSLPGEPPKVVTGSLRSSIDHAIVIEPNAVRGFIGVRRGVTRRFRTVVRAGKRKPARRQVLTETYGLYLEFGTSRMAARPYLRPTVILNRRALGRLIATGRP